MHASINGKTIVTIRDEHGQFHAVELASGDGFDREADALRDGIERVLNAEETAEARREAEKLCGDECFGGISNERTAALLRAAALLGRTVNLTVQRVNGDWDRVTFSVQGVGSESALLFNEDHTHMENVLYSRIKGGYVHDADTDDVPF